LSWGSVALHPRLGRGRYTGSQHRSDTSPGLADATLSATWLQTTRRVLPRLARLSREIRPTAHLSSVAALTPEKVQAQGVRTILWDVDGTLMSHHAKAPASDLADPLERLFSDPSLRHAIVSNCQEDRLEELGGMFPQVPVLLGYETEQGAAFRVRRDGTDTWRGEGVSAGEPAKLVRPIRKPSARLLQAALDELGVADKKDSVLMVGDQYLTDIASANLAGVRSIKVPTLRRSSFPVPVRLSQHLENLLYRILYGKPDVGWADWAEES